MHEKEIELLVKRVERFQQRIAKLILRDDLVMEACYRHCPRPVPFAERLAGEFTPITEGATWGSAWDNAWFRLRARVPREWKGRHVVAQLCFNGEGLVFDKRGVPLQGITNGSIFDANFSRDLVSLYPSARGGEDVTLWVEAACNGLYGVELQEDPAEGQADRYGRYAGVVNRIRLAVLDEELWRLRLDVKVLHSLLAALAPASVRHARILHALNRAIDCFGDDPANTKAARALLAAELAKPAHASALTATAVGHAHIDTGWLWPVSEAVRKCARTYASQLRLLDRYPGYVFGASQPQHYAFVKEHYPALYKKIRQAIQAGRWECQGGMWVEADCNLISGESMVRQFVFGKNFFMDEFGVDVRNLWLPDVFGYSAALPQIIRKAGCDAFVTQKISWNQFNRFPHSTFRWRGIDGSEVVTHFPPEDTYNGTLQPELLSKGERNFRERGYLPGFMALFGIGDGGGGPHEEHIEAGLRQRDLEGSPKVQFGRAQDFLDGLRDVSGTLPVWSGELYLELHRGTLTTQARTKRGNRLLENRLRQTEYLWSCLPLRQYPQAELARLWKTLLINQFHDILPGSSITRVYAETSAQHAAALDACDRLLRKAAGRCFVADADCVTLVNCLSRTCRHQAVLPEGWEGAVGEDGVTLEAQVEENGRVVAAVTLPAQQAVTLRRSAGTAAASPARRGLTLENALIRYEFNRDGTIKRIFDKECRREVLAEGASGNVLSLYEDRPNAWDAWDVDLFYEQQLLEHARPVKAVRLAGGAVRQRLALELAIGASRIAQIVSLAADSKRLDFGTSVDWREKHRMLRVAFAVDVRSSSFSSDIQYGYVERPTHRNTSWDMARFEVVAHRYVDLSDPDYGVALLNDCKYGHKVHENVLDLNLLRSPTHPDPDADQGVHEFTYSLLPHDGPLIGSQVMAEAAALNLPPLVFEGMRGGLQPPCLLAVERGGVSLEVLKKAEKESCVVVRLVETEGRRSVCRLLTDLADVQFEETNLMEWSSEGGVDAGATLEMKPFEIRTFKLLRKC